MGGRLKRLHDDEVEISLDLVRHLVDTQFPQFRGEPITPVTGIGTVNRIFRLGDDRSVRLPCAPRFAPSIEREQQCLPLLADKLPLEIPRLYEIGRPTRNYPLPWSIHSWISGSTWVCDQPADETSNAMRLGAFVRQLQQLDRGAAPRSTRDRPLADRDQLAREAIEKITEFEQRQLLRAWEACLSAPPWSGEVVWTHADLLPPNLLTGDGNLVAAIDFGSVGGGDPALDLSPAWAVFGEAGRGVYRDTVGAADGTWHRGRGLALFQALLIIPYYRASNPAFTRSACRTVRQILGGS